MAFRSWPCVGLVAMATGLAGCVFDGGPSVGAASAPVVAAPATPALGAFLESGAGAKLGESDREAAFQAETQALSSGERKAWRGTKGVYGYVVPGASAAAAGGAGPASGECRSFTHTIYFGGRPEVGRGTGCRTGDGTWRVTS